MTADEPSAADVERWARNLVGRDQAARLLAAEAGKRVRVRQPVIRFEYHDAPKDNLFLGHRIVIERIEDGRKERHGDYSPEEFEIERARLRKLGYAVNEVWIGFDRRAGQRESGRKQMLRELGFRRLSALRK